MLNFAIFPPLFFFATDGFNEISISHLIFIEAINLASALAFACFPNSSYIFCCILTILILLIFASYISGLVFSIKSLIKYGIHFHFSILAIVIAIAIDVVVGILFCIQGTVVGKILGCILSGFGFYFVFYNLQAQINPISLLLFWADLWTILSVIYAIIEKYINGEDES